MLKKIILAFAATILLVFGVFAQISPKNSYSLNEILTKSEEQTAVYRETFKNLLAVETKTFESYDKNGKLKKTNIVESNFFVYQSAKNNKISFELRNVFKVDGKSVPESETKSEAFYAELNKTSTLKSELDKIQKISSKYDKTFDISGITLYEGIILSSNLRPSFDFKLIGAETYRSHEVYLISYQQTKKSPFISINGKGIDTSSPSLDFSFEMPGDLKKNDVFLQGKLWIDSTTFRIWREERTLAIQTPEPLSVLETTFEYQPSDYEILVPKQIKFAAHKLKKNNGKYQRLNDLIITFDYSQFKKSETDVKVIDEP